MNALLLASLLCLAAPAAGESVPPEDKATAAPGPGPVYVVRLDDDDFAAVSRWNTAYLGRCLRRAEQDKASFFLIELSSNGGFVTTAFKMSETLRQEHGFRTATLVLNRAYSAGALIALSCDEIYMQQGSVIGDALPVSIIPTPSETPDEDKEGNRKTVRRPDIEKKQISALSAYFQQAAQHKGHSPVLAAAMVDPDLEVLGVIVDGEAELHTRQMYDEKYPTPESRVGHQVTVLDSADRLLTVGPDVAVDWGLAKAEVVDRQEVLRLTELEGLLVVECIPGWHEKLGRFFSSIAVTVLLIAIAILALYVELNKPTGLGAAVFLTALAAFFWANYLAGTAGPISIILFLAGLALLLVEIFFIPGFGITGISGIVLMLAGMIAARLPDDIFSPRLPTLAPPGLRWTWLGDAVVPLVAGVAAGCAGIILLMRFFPHLPFLGRLVLRTDMGAAVVSAAQAAGAASVESMVGMIGTAATKLRPGGSARIGGRLLDVVSDGEFIEAGTPVVVISAVGNRIMVRKGTG